MPTFQSCIVYLTDNKEVYRKGDVVSGTATLDVTKKVDIQAIRIQLIGEALVKWETRQTRYSSLEETVAKEKYFRVDSNNLEENTHNTLKPGQHVYNFRINIPDQDLPSSYEGLYGAIRYWIKVKVKTSFPNRNRKWHRIITILANVDVNDSLLTSPIRRSSTKDFEDERLGTFGTLTLTSAMDRGGYCPGESIFLSVVTKNNSTKDCRCLKSEFLQIVKFTAENVTKTKCITLGTIEESPVLKGQEIVWTQRKFDIDAIPPTTTSGPCKAIVVSYYVKLRVDFEVDNWFPITIGTKSYCSAPVQEIKCRQGIVVNDVSDGDFVSCRYTPMCVYVPDYIINIIPELPLHSPRRSGVDRATAPRMRKESDLPPSYDEVMAMTDQTVTRDEGGATAAPPPRSATPADLPPSYHEFLRTSSTQGVPVEVHKHE